MKEISAGIIIFRRTPDGPRFLLLYHGGQYWNFAKGKVEATEGSYGAALREIKEETGLGRADLKFNTRFQVYDRFVFFRDKQKVFKKVTYFLAETRKSQIRISPEHKGYGWFLYKDALRLLIYRNLKNNLKRAYDIIREKGL